MNILCKFNFHKWDIIESITAEQLEEDVKAEREHYTPKLISYHPKNLILYKKTCQRCGEEFDTVTSYRWYLHNLYVSQKLKEKQFKKLQNYFK